MAIGSPTPLHEFYEFLGRRIADGQRDLTPEDSVRDFRRYQEELQRLVDETQPAVEQSRRGDVRPLDVSAVMQRVEARLAQGEHPRP